MTGVTTCECVYDPFPMQLITVTIVVLLTLKSSAIPSTATAIVTTNPKPNSDELNSTNAKSVGNSVALQLSEPLISVSEQRLPKEVLNNYPKQMPSDNTDGYYGKCSDDVSHDITPTLMTVGTVG